MRQTSTNRRRNQRGAYLVETALVIIAFLSMLFFVIDMGRVLLTEQYITERARAGARYASVNSWDTTAIKNYVCYNSSTAPGGGASGMFGLLPSQVEVQQKGSGAPWGTGWDDRVQVTVSGISLFAFVPYWGGSFVTRSITVNIPVASLGATN